MKCLHAADVEGLQIKTTVNIQAVAKRRQWAVFELLTTVGPNLLILFKKIIPIYSKNHTKHINTKWKLLLVDTKQDGHLVRSVTSYVMFSATIQSPEKCAGHLMLCR
jgi:hypothetical protein